VFNPEVANNLVGNTVNTILNAGRGDVISVGLVVSLWAGSSAISAFIEAITIAYRQHEFRPAALERLFALGVYLVALVFGIILLPLLAIGPQYLIRLLPARWQGTGTTIVSISYYPVTAVLLILLLATLYRVAPKRKHPWRRGLPGALLAAAVFLIASFGLRLYLSYVYTHGLTYGALATPITFLLFYYPRRWRSSWAPSSTTPCWSTTRSTRPDPKTHQRPPAKTRPHLPRPSHPLAHQGRGQPAVKTPATDLNPSSAAS